MVVRPLRGQDNVIDCGKIKFRAIVPENVALLHSPTSECVNTSERRVRKLQFRTRPEREIVSSFKLALLVVFGVVVDAACAVDLLQQHDPRQLMWEGHPRHG